MKSVADKRKHTPGFGAKASIFIVEDHPVFRDGLTQLINKERDMEVVGSAESAGEAMAALARVRPDLLIVDITLKESSGIELISDVAKAFGAVPILVLSMHDESVFLDRVIKAGARGYITKRETTQKIIDAIRQVLRGRIYISEQMVDQVLTRYARGGGEAAVSPIEELSHREFEVFNLIGQGLANRRIAAMLSVSSKTVATYRERIKEKLNIESSSELNKYAIWYFQLEKNR